MPEEPLILVVDDTPENLEVISEALMDAGYEVAAATNGERALRQLQYSFPDLILLDIQMPILDGFETCKRLKENSETASIPVIFMTALSDTDSKVKGFDLGAVDYITKPFQEKEVLARVKTHIDLYNLTQELEKKVEKRTSDLSRTLHELQASQVKLVKSEKMSALGQLVSGIAHEINNPVGCISGNIVHAESYIKDLLNLIDLYQQYYSHPVEEIAEEIEAIDLDFLREDLPKLIHSMQEGTKRLQTLSTSMRTFSRSDTSQKIPFDLHQGLESTLLILKHRLKAKEQRPAIEIVKNYGSLPPVHCYPGQLNQVFTNIIANAIDALEENLDLRIKNEENTSQISNLNSQVPTPTIQIRTEPINPDWVEICIADNGPGISIEVKEHLFDHLFTTKGVGKGTGLGLSISRQIVVDKHGGQLACHSAPGEGTEFIIKIPIS